MIGTFTAVPDGLDRLPSAILGWQVETRNISIDPAAQLLWQDEVMRVWRVPSDTSYCVDFGNGLTLFADMSSRSILVPTGWTASRETLAHLLNDQLLPRLVANDGALVLHAAVVEGPTGALLFVGEAGAGKSTLSAAVAERGYRLAGDDSAVIGFRGNAPFARSIYPSLRLLPDSIDALGLADLAGSPMADYSDKRRIELSSIEDPHREMPIRAIIALDRDEAPEIAIEPVAGAGICRILLEQSFALDASHIGDARGRLSEIARLAASVPSFTLRFPRRFDALDRVCDAVMALAVPAKGR